MSRNDKAITPIEISELIQVDKWFSKKQFMELTKTPVGTANGRLRTFVIKGYFSSKQGMGRSFMYKMSDKQKEKIAAESKPRPARKVAFTEAEIQARSRAKKKVIANKIKVAEDILKKVGFI